MSIQKQSRQLILVVLRQDDGTYLATWAPIQEKVPGEGSGRFFNSFELCKEVLEKEGIAPMGIAELESTGRLEVLLQFAPSL